MLCHYHQHFFKLGCNASDQQIIVTNKKRIVYIQAMALFDIVWGAYCRFKWL